MAAAPSGQVHGALVFSDLAGFTAFTAECGDDAAVALVDRFEHIVRAALPADGRVVKLLGDGIFLFLPEPAQAVRTMLDVARLCEQESSPATPMWVRTGVHAGAARVHGDDLIGHDVNLAARITDLAEPGEVLVSAQAAALVPLDGVRFEPLAPAFVKGISEPVHLFRALVP